ncbi:MAG: 30S ribosome-binding factor RbfA [Patescibacteria group bacterium]
MDHRPERVGKLIREELSLIILKELEFPGALLTITEVEVNSKLEHAVVRVSVIPSERAEEALNKLQESRGRLQHLLFKKINIRPMPKIDFRIDRGPENAANVEKLLFKKDDKKPQDTS